MKSFVIFPLETITPTNARKSFLLSAVLAKSIRHGADCLMTRQQPKSLYKGDHQCVFAAGLCLRTGNPRPGLKFYYKVRWFEQLIE